MAPKMQKPGNWAAYINGDGSYILAGQKEAMDVTDKRELEAIKRAIEAVLAQQG